MENWRLGGFGLYIHWPFCQSKCPYCDFNSHVAEQIDQERWKRAYFAELERAAVPTNDRILQTVFFGGGTPSLMDGRLVAAILEKVRSLWTMVNDPEITLEANPTSVEKSRFNEFKTAGVNRLSLGLQALDDHSLRLLGRSHSADDALRAYDLARRTFPRSSFDLICARQGQTLRDWQRELTSALDLSPDHLSLYQLTIEDGTVFGRRHAAGQLHGLPSEDLAADLYLLTQELCQAAGLRAYEVSNHARPGEECRHNQVYWRQGDYIGVGPGAHGRMTLDGQRWATEAIRAPAQWLRDAESAAGALRAEALTQEDCGNEYLLMGLRLEEGIDLERYESLTGQPTNPSKIAALQQSGHLVVESGRLRVTPPGRILLNSVIKALL